MNEMADEFRRLTVNVEEPNGNQHLVYGWIITMTVGEVYTFSMYIRETKDNSSTWRREVRTITVGTDYEINVTIPVKSMPVSVAQLSYHTSHNPMVHTNISAPSLPPPGHNYNGSTEYLPQETKDPNFCSCSSPEPYDVPMIMSVIKCCRKCRLEIKD